MTVTDDYLYVQGARDGFVSGFLFTAVWVVLGAAVRAAWRGLR